MQNKGQSYASEEGRHRVDDQGRVMFASVTGVARGDSSTSPDKEST